MKLILFLIIFNSNLYCYAGLILPVSNKIFKNSELSFIENKGEGRFSSYLVMQVSYQPAAELFKELLIQGGYKLMSRGEAHITVITPLEYYDTLKEKITIDEINKIAKDLEIQKAQFNIVCLGRGEAKLDEKLEQTFFLVVESKDLLKIRKEVRRLFVSRGGDESSFIADNYFPHITIGYTKRDLHESDEVIKSIKSCHANILII